ncbi:MAG TPA: hypothetical protein VLE69_00950 [Candidatus Saccharimonadales bacterium]|nr:hypothetical protein [Candidatus Saccharimonadales bacterium]
MAEVLSSVEDMFQTPEFSLQLTEWRRARLRAGEAEGSFGEYIGNWFGEGSGSQDMGETVDYYIGMGQDEFEERGEMMFDDKALKLSRVRTTSKDTENKEKQILLEIGRDQGANEFALYGLWLHMRKSEPISITRLKESISSAEADLSKVDKLVRNNAGNVLTVLQLATLQAGRLGEGGISIEDNRHVVLPHVDGTRTFSASIHKDMPEVYFGDEPIMVMAHRIHSILGSDKVRVASGWPEVLDISRLDTNADTLFIPGEVVEGPPIIEAGKNREYDQMVFDKIRAVGTAATLGY